MTQRTPRTHTRQSDPDHSSLCAHVRTRPATMSKDKSLENLSRAMSSLLRHNAIKEGVDISADGWVRVSDALNWAASRKRLNGDEAMVRRLVADNDKQRFSLRETDGVLEIRANQGHSMNAISVEMKQLPSSVKHAVHGTYHAAWSQIQKTGLSKMKRQHVHLARGLPGGSGVISGMRASCEVLVWVDVQRAVSAGMTFYESDNGVILTDGFNGTVPPEFFDRVEERKTGRLMWRPPSRDSDEAGSVKRQKSGDSEPASSDS